ncbi:MAG: hypothetical protein WAV16_00810 [Candidatus Moraniibacteriota bacterium]
MKFFTNCQNCGLENTCENCPFIMDWASWKDDMQKGIEAKKIAAEKITPKDEQSAIPV